MNKEDLSPIAQARDDFRHGLGIDEIPARFIKDSPEWNEYRMEWYNLYTVKLHAEQEELFYTGGTR